MFSFSFFFTFVCFSARTSWARRSRRKIKRRRRNWDYRWGICNTIHHESPIFITIIINIIIQRRWDCTGKAPKIHYILLLLAPLPSPLTPSPSPPSSLSSPGPEPRWGFARRRLHVRGERLGRGTYIWSDWHRKDSGELSIYSRILALTEQEPNRDFDGDQKMLMYHKEFE